MKNDDFSLWGKQRVASLNCTFFGFQPILPSYYYLNLWSRLFHAMEFYGKCHKSHKLHTSVEIKNATSVFLFSFEFWLFQEISITTYLGTMYIGTYICLATIHRMDHRCQKSKQKLDEVLKRNCILLPKGRPCVVVESYRVLFEKKITFAFSFLNCVN